MKILKLKCFCISLLAGFIWAAALDGTAQAHGLAYWLRAYSNNNMSAQAAIDAQGLVDSSGYWWAATNGPFNGWDGTMHIFPHVDTLYTVSFQRIRDFYKPDNQSIWVTTEQSYTNYYYMYSNSLSVVVTGITDGASARWQLTAPAEYTNSSKYSTYGTNFTDSFTVSNIPNGSYTITFKQTNGYTTPSAVTTNISPALVNIVTGTYTRQTTTIQVNVSPTNGIWRFNSYPSDFTTYSSSRLTGTNSATITNAPVGIYTIEFLAILGYNLPVPATVTATNNLDPTTFSGTYSNGYQLIVHVVTATDTTNTLNGIGTGSVSISPTNVGVFDGVETWLFSSGSTPSIIITAVPSTNPTPRSFFYKWSGDIGSATPTVNPITLAMSQNRSIKLYFSKAKYAYDNVGDIDGDGLPDEWELAKNLNPESAAGNDGASGNEDDDWIPSAYTNVPITISIDTNHIATYTFSGNGYPSYPLQRAQLLIHLSTELPVGGSQLGYGKGMPFNNLLECRGLDGYYLTNTPAGVSYSSPYGDDPLTNPKEFDSQNTSGSTTEKISDGWKYYFWYWRSADAYSAGVSNSANLAWVNFWRVAGGIDMDEGMADGDGDGFFDSEEYHDYWTDPTHCDTDADGMDDYWEISVITPSANSNALDYVNNWSNPDGDYMAWVNQGLLTTGMVGTALGTNVYWTGGSAANPNAAWNQSYTNTGTNVFDLYQDTILKASAVLTNHATGDRYAFTNYFGTNTGLTYKDGYPVWVDADNSGTYSAGDYAIANPSIKHDAIYVMAPATSFPGVCSFDPRTAWTNLVAAGTNEPEAAPNTVPYTTYQEYLGGDYIGRLSWDAGGQKSTKNDDEFTLNRNSYSLPNNQDTDADLMPDGWELYVGLNPNNSADAGADPDEDKLNNLGEWANAIHSLGNCLATWPNKLLPTDPGVLTAPSPNDPHPKDTDWDGLGDNLERANNSNPTAYDTDNDRLPDGWEIYAGTSVINADSDADPDGDGLSNFEEYWTGAVPEWQYTDAYWDVLFLTRKIMPWDPAPEDLFERHFIPPDFLTDGSFMYYNLTSDVSYLRINYPATLAIGEYEENYVQYHTTLANDPDSDHDGMDDYWEVYHGLNPCKGFLDMMMPGATPPAFRASWYDDVDIVDADSTTSGFQVGRRTGGAFSTFAEMVSFVHGYGTNRVSAIAGIVGPFNFGLQQMDPDGDGLPNLEEYSYSPNRTFYHTDPTPIWRTDSRDTTSFVSLNYTWDAYPYFGLDKLYDPFSFEEKEGFDTDNDGAGDYAEINAAAGQLGNNPLDERNPIRNRALVLNGTNDFARTLDSWVILSESFLTRFGVEAWVKPDNPARGEQVILEKAGLYRNPYNTASTIVGANFRIGITNGLPYVLYNGRGSLRAYQATAQMKHRITSNTNWTHIAGSYDGTNLNIYVNGEESYSLPTTELPATGVNSADSQGTNSTFYNADGHTMMIGARDFNCGNSIVNHSQNIQTAAPASCFSGCIDEVRVWDGARSRAEILANMNRRIPRLEMTNLASSLEYYYSFDDVPDPARAGESIVPAGLTDLDTTMSFHPAISWWASQSQHSTVYTGLSNSYNYLVSAADHVAHLPRTVPMDDKYHFSSNYLGTNALENYNNLGNPYEIPSIGNTTALLRWYDTGIIKDMVLFRGARSVATNSWLSGLTDDPDSTDTDGDGLPDWWEQLYGLDPNDAAGDNGAWGDPDNDGLNNRAEYLAGTSPRNSDTDGDGIGDYDSRSGPYTRTWGEMYMDGDGMPDTWEMQYGLDPYHYDAHLDLDNDGWSNLAEYQAGTNPNDAKSYPQPSVSGSADYFGDKSGTFKFFVYSTNTMDGEPLITQVGAGQQVAETIGTTDGTLYFTGSLPIYPIDQATVVRVSAPAGTNGVVVTFTFTGPNTNAYSGSGTDWSATLNYTTGKLNIRWASTEVPVVGASVGVDYTYANRNSAAFSLTGFREGDFYLLALLDTVNNNTFDAGEPLGIMEGQPFTLGYTSLSGMRIHVKDNAPGYGRFAWTGNTTGTSDYPVVINKISEQNAPTVLTRTVRWSRNFFHEWDYQIAGLYGLPTGNYQWWMNGQQGTFNVTWPASVSTPSLVYPRGEQFNYAVNQLKWTMDANSTMYHLQVARKASDGGYAFVIDQYYSTPYSDANGVYQADLPLYAGELGNGVYYWRVASWSPAGESAWAEPQTFNINLSATNSHWIAGDIYYFGKADCANIIVEAFDNRGFSGKPEARVLLTGASRSHTNSFKGSFTLRGLEQGSYYVRAYLDVTPAGETRDGKRNSPWESWGFIRDPNNDYRPRTIPLLDTMFVDGTKLVIRDQDTDNDLLPDAWEMYYFGNLNQTGDMDYDGDGETNLEEYMRDDVDMNPACWDTDGDGLSDAFELNYTAPSFGYSAKSGLQLNPTLWDTDGDNYSDGAEMKRYHTDPLDPLSYPRYQPMCFDASRSPGDYDGDGRSDLGVYDVTSGNWYLMTAAGGFFNLPFGSSATQPMLGDYDGDGCEDFAVFEPATGAWHLYNAWTGQSFSMNYGDSEMIPVPADYDGDNKTDLAVYYPADGMWYIYSVWSGQFYSLQFGGPTCVPVPGDYNNDGAGDLATYEPTTGNWNIFTFDHYRYEGKYFSGNFGGPTMMPAGGDYDGDGRNDAALFEANTGNWYILTWRGQFLSGQFGCYGCIPAPGDYDGDGRTDVCVYYPPTGTWYIYCWSGQAYQVQFGFPAAAPALKGR